MDPATAIFWGALGGGIATAIVRAAIDVIEWVLRARQERRKLTLWRHIYPRLSSSGLDKDQILRDCLWLKGEGKFYSLLYQLIRDRTIDPQFLFKP